MEKTKDKPVVDMLQEDIRVIGERVKIIVAKMNRWRDEVKEPKTATMLSEGMNRLRNIPQDLMIISIMAACAQGEIRQKKDKPDEPNT